MGAEARDVVPVSNATSAANAVLRSLKLRPGDFLLMTSLTYGAVKNAMAHAASLSLSVFETALFSRNWL